MYRCQACGENQSACAPLNRVITETRPKEYSPREDIRGKADRGGRGWEIAKEINCCSICAIKIKPNIPAPRIEQAVRRSDVSQDD